MKVFEQKEIIVDLSRLIDSRMLICANSGGGKSYAIRKFLESDGGKVVSIVLDVEGEFKTLREKYDYLLIGQTGDVPISMEAAHLLPKKLMELNVSSVIDISDFKMRDRILYVKKFLEALMSLPRKYWKPCLVIVDEAHMYCGQREKQESTHAVIDLMTRGRKRGFCGVLATQRIAKLHKDAVAEANNYMVGRLGLDIDMKRASDILGFTTKADMLSLRNLKAGEFYVFGPAISRSVKKAKVSKVYTTHPKVGMDLKEKLSPPTKKIKALLSELSDLPKEAEQQVRTLRQAETKVRELERKLKKSHSVTVDVGQIEAAENRGVVRAEKALRYEIQIMKGKLDKIAALAKYSETAVVVKPSPRKHAVADMPAGRLVRSAKQDAADDKYRLGRCERSVLSLLYNNSHRSFNKTSLGLLTGYSYKSGGFNNALSKLNSLGLIARNNGEVSLLREREADACEILGDDVGLHETFNISNWAQKLPRCSSVIFQFLIDNPASDGFAKVEIAEGTGYQPNSGGFNNAISKLNQLGLIKRQNGIIILNTEDWQR